MAPSVLVKVHPVVLFSIVDSYERRNEGADRVIGTLLGVHEKGAVEITNCFCVPHNENGDEVAVNMEFAKAMYDLHRKVNSSEVIVGWYATGIDVSDHSLLIHEYYSYEVNNPVHLTVDTKLTGDQMNIKAYTSTHFGVPQKKIGTMFTPCKVEVVGYEPELVGLKVTHQTRYNKQRSVEILPDLDQISSATQKMQSMFDMVINYVDDVLAGRVTPDNSIGRALMDTVQSIPQMDPDNFKEMLNSNMKDLLMVVYLSHMTKAQIALHEKLSMV